MSGMTVNFNNLRKQAIYAYDRLTQKLNDAIIKNDEQYAEPNDESYQNIKGYVLINAEEIQKDMDSLRQMIGSIAMTYIEGDNEFKDVFQELFPEEHEGLKHFNEENDEDEE